MKDKMIILKPDESIEYDVLDKVKGGGSLGRAEFTFCPVISKGKFIEVHIYRLQQRRDDKHYVVRFARGLDKSTGISFKDKNRENVAPWNYQVCAEHKCPVLSVYVPDGTSKLSYDLSSIQTSFCFE